MAARWHWLIACTMLTFGGLAMTPLDGWTTAKLVLVGVALATIIAAHEISGPVRWSAAVALVCMAPTAQELVRESAFLMERIRELAMLFTLAGVLGSVTAAVSILLVPESPERAARGDDERVASARVLS